MKKAFLLGIVVVAAACGSSDDDPGTRPGAGGAPTAGTGGGVVASGGAGSGTSAGGSPSPGGAGGGAVTGGAAGSNTGGTATTGGVTSSGGAAPSSGGASPATGGAGGAGGSVGSGGTAGSGGGSGPVTCPSTATLKPGETTETIQVGGVSRTFILHVPRGYTGSSPVPLVVDFHPLLSSGTYQRTNSGYANLSDQKGFIVAFPNGIDRAWNIGPCCTSSRTVDDVGFARGIVETVKARGCVDPKRVFAAGYSMGGGLSHHLACKASDVFAAVSPAAFDLLEENVPDCKPSRPISVLMFRGTADPIVPYTGGASRPPNGLNVTIHFLGAKGSIEKWAALNGCNTTPVAGANGCSTYPECDGGVDVTLCTAQGGGHVTGDATQGWAMFEKHPMP